MRLRALLRASLSGIGSTSCFWSIAERFMRILKEEEVDGRAYRDLDQVRGSIASFIEEVCNRQRLHSALAYLAPAEFEARISAPAVKAA